MKTKMRFGGLNEKATNVIDNKYANISKNFLKDNYHMVRDDISFL
jgi:hypothetical protein